MQPEDNQVYDNNLSVQDFLSQTGVSYEDLNAEALKPQPTSLSLANYNVLVLQLSKSHPTFMFDRKSRHARVMKRGLIPNQILRAEDNIRAWKREMQALLTCDKADRVLASADAEMRLLDRMGTAGVVHYNDKNPLKHKRRPTQDMEDDEEGKKLNKRLHALSS